MVAMSTPSPGHQQHLYLVLDGSEDACSIHKVDVRDFDPDDDDLHSRAPRPLPNPPFLRVEAEPDNAARFVAHGTKIFAMATSPGRPGGAGLALDTRTMRITCAPLPQANTADQYFCSSLVAVGDSIYSMDRREDGARSCNFEVLRLGSRPWSWSSVPSQPPFDPLHVCCYAVHPDGRTVFFSVAEYGRGASTFSFDAETARWSFRGNWTLPFHGQAYYDVELDAWVGLDDDCYRKGRVSSCDVAPPATGGDEGVDRLERAPPSKLTKERLFRAKGRRCKGGALVYMGDSTFCAVECVTDGKLTREQRKRLELDGQQPRLLLYVRVFGLKYGKKGRLQVATCGRRARCYELPEGTRCACYDEIVMNIRALWA
jgi:hypothetical protein